MIKRRRYTPEFKAQVFLEILTEQRSIAHSRRQYSIKDSILSRWNQEFIERSPELFEQSGTRDERGHDLEVTLLDVSILVFRTLERDYDPTDQSSANGVLEGANDCNSLITGFYYIKTDNPQ